MDQSHAYAHFEHSICQRQISVSNGRITRRHRDPSRSFSGHYPASGRRYEPRRTCILQSRVDSTTQSSGIDRRQRCSPTAPPWPGTRRVRGDA